MTTPFWRRRRAARSRPRWNEFAPDADNGDRQAEARFKMEVFDGLGERARRAARESRFDALDASRVRRRYGCATDFSDPRVDELVAGQVKADDDYHSGLFGPAYPTGI